MLLSDFDFDLPSELIARYPADKRDGSRLMIVRRDSGEISEVSFRDITGVLTDRDLLLMNNTKVFPARLFGKQASGGAVEVLLTSRQSDDTWEALAKPGKKLRENAQVFFGPDLSGTVVKDSGYQKTIRFRYTGDFFSVLAKIGQIPLPPYMKRAVCEKIDGERYQTVYADRIGSIAAPTAGLHFTPELLETLAQKGVRREMLTLHIGLGTFHPVTVSEIKDHVMHKEKYFLPLDLVDTLHKKDYNRLICVGTTTLRALESACDENGNPSSGAFTTDIFIRPGYSFKRVRHLLTNFHLPKSTLFILISAFMGPELARKAYQWAIKEKFRFFSYGDAMLIL